MRKLLLLLLIVLCNAVGGGNGSTNPDIVGADLTTAYNSYRLASNCGDHIVYSGRVSKAGTIDKRLGAAELVNMRRILVTVCK